MDVDDQQKLKEILAGFQSKEWEGDVYRYMLADNSPERENVRGARWNPPQVAAIYTSLQRETAIAEVEYRLKLEPCSLRPDIRKTIYRIKIKITSLIDLSDDNSLKKVGIDREKLSNVDYSICQCVGGCIEWLEHDGLLVPSVRDEGTNLVIFPSNRKNNYLFEVVEEEEI